MRGRFSRLKSAGDCPREQHNFLPRENAGDADSTSSNEGGVCVEGDEQARASPPQPPSPCRSLRHPRHKSAYGDTKIHECVDTHNYGALLVEGAAPPAPFSIS